MAKVARGDAACERDSVTFAEPDYPFPILAGLLRAALENGRTLAVLDFGGSLGSTYYQCRCLFPEGFEVDWYVVEQEHFVRRGKNQFETERLHFCFSANEVAARTRPDVVLLSSVLQFLERPYDTLRELSGVGSRYLLVDRTPFSSAPQDRLTVQRVPPAIYAASYPCRIFSRDRFVSALQGEWAAIAQFASGDGWAVADGHCFRYGGMLFKRRP